MRRGTSAGKAVASVVGAVVFGVAGACAPAPAGPDVAVLRWMQAFAAQDGTTLASLTCQASQADFQNSRLLNALGVSPPTFGAGGGGGGQFFGGGGGGQPVYDVSALQYATTFVDAQSARVRVTGALRMASGMNSQIQTVNGIVTLLQEQRLWRLCESSPG